MEFSFVPEDSHTRIAAEDEGEDDDYELNALNTVDVVVTRSMKIKNVKEVVLAELKLDDINPDDLVVCNQKMGKISEMFKDTTSCNDIDQDREYTMVYHVPNQTEETKVIEFNFIKHMKRGKNNYTTDFVDKSAPRLFALSNDTTIMDVKRMVLTKLRGIFETDPETDEKLNEIVQVHVRDNLPYVQQGKYGMRMRPVCDIYGIKHSYKDDYGELTLELNEGDDANESVENATNATIGQIYEKMQYERRLILAIVIKSAGNPVNFNELRCKYRRVGDMTLDSRA